MDVKMSDGPMDEDLATIVIATSLRAARDLSDLVPIISDVDDELKFAISSIVYDIMENIVSNLQSKNPKLRLEIEARLEKFGRAY